MSDNSDSNEFLKSLEKYNLDIGEYLPAHRGPKLILNFNKITSISEVEGIILKGREIENGIIADIVIKEGVTLEDPVHLCFGVNKETGLQEIFPRIIAEDNSNVTLQAHCSFPNAKDLTHKMFGHIYIGKNCKLIYNETHYHGENNGATVAPVSYVYVGEKSYFENNFFLTQGTIGRMKIQLDIYAFKDSIINSNIKAFGKNSLDSIRVRDAVFLEGENARSIIKMKAAAINGGEVMMFGITEGNAANTTGHVDCTEIVKDRGSRCRAIPLIRATDDSCHITHEASLGKVDSAQLNALMARGLDEVEATDLIIKNML
jgi:Fe-S cluster assembly scaffold protein SufB